MTPEQAESMLQGLAMPAPPTRLRRRVLGHASPFRRPSLVAMAAALAAFAVVFWAVAGRPAGSGAAPARPQDEAALLIERLGHEDPGEREKARARLLELGAAAEAELQKARSHRDPEIASQANAILGILDRKRRFGKLTTDPALQERIEGLLRANPGKAVLMTRLFLKTDADLKAVTTADFKMSLYLGESPTPVPCEAPEADGHLLFVVPSGKMRISGTWWSPPQALRAQYLVWDGFGDIEAADVHRLPDLHLVAPMEWIAPAAGAKLSVKDDPKLSWKAYPGVVKTRLQLEAAFPTPGGENRMDLGSVEVEGTFLHLGRLLKASREPVKTGTRLGVTLFGSDAEGRKVSGNSSPRWFELAE